MMRAGTLAAWLLRALCRRRAGRFAQALSNPAAAQAQTLQRIIAASSRTTYGRTLGLDPSEGLAGFRRRVPVVDYAALAPILEKQRESESAEITPGRIVCHEPTSGSGGAKKLIPYNRALLASFRGMFAIWADDLLRNHLRLRSGRVFMSVSAPVRDSGEGMQEDDEYLGPLMRLLVGRFLVLPPRGVDGEGFRDQLVLALLDCAELEVISIWNPGYLLILLEHFEAHRERLLPRVKPGRRAALSANPIAWQAVWPQLQLISCWSEAAAARPADRLRRLFPQALVQGKGLLATEAPVSVPLLEAGACVPLVDEVFLEFEDDDGRLRLLQETEPGCEYSLIVTQPGGLLRYRLGDRVRCGPPYRGTPTLGFVGRADAVADIVGEKLAEDFVAGVLADQADEAFAMLLPLQPEQGHPHYLLLCDQDIDAEALDLRLQEAFRYREARRLGQLDQVTVRHAPDMRTRVHAALTECGLKDGDIKDRALLPSLELATQLATQLAT